MTSRQPEDQTDVLPEEAVMVHTFVTGHQVVKDVEQSFPSGWRR